MGSSQTDYGRRGLVQNCITWFSNNTLQSEVVYDFVEFGSIRALATVGWSDFGRSHIPSSQRSMLEANLIGQFLYATLSRTFRILFDATLQDLESSCPESRRSCQCVEKIHCLRFCGKFS